MSSDRLDQNGQWWEPGAPGAAWPGRLTELDDGFLLRVAFEDDGGFLSPSPKKYRLIYGHAVDGSLYTLSDCFDRRSTRGSSGMVEKEIRVNQVFRGFHVPEHDERPFRSAQIGHPFLRTWLGASGFSADLLPEGQGFRIEYHGLPGRTFSTADEGVAHISWYASPVFPSALDEVTELRESVALTVKPPSPQPLEYFDAHRSALRALLALATRQDASWPSMSLQGAFDSFATPDGQVRYPEGTLLRKSREPSSPRLPHPYLDMTFTAQDLGDQLEACLGRWFEQAANLRPVTNLFSAATAGRGFLEERFLAVTQGLETLHRRVYGGEFMPDTEFRANVLPLLVAAIPSSLSCDHRSMLKTRFQYLNEFSLRRRLRDLLRRYSAPIATIFGVTPDIAVEVVDCRNLLTHLPPGTGHDTLNRRRLLFLTDLAKTLLEFCLLEVLGLGVDRITDLVASREFYRRQAVYWRRDA